MPPVDDRATLVARIDAALPQTQCTRCGYPDCRGYAEAVASGTAGINQCPPGGAAGIARLADLTGRPALPLNPTHGVEGPRRVARIDEPGCIGCTLCLQACPVDAIAGAPKRMHTVLAAWCTGCELCLPPCPTDCIVLDPLPDPQLAAATGWAAWSAEQAAAAAARHAARREREHRLQREREQALERARPRHMSAPTAGPGAAPAPGPTAAAPGADAASRHALIEAALERARRRQAERAGSR